MNFAGSLRLSMLDKAYKILLDAPGVASRRAATL